MLCTFFASLRRPTTEPMNSDTVINLFRGLLYQCKSLNFIRGKKISHLVDYKTAGVSSACPVDTTHLFRRAQRPIFLTLLLLLLSVTLLSPDRLLRLRVIFSLMRRGHRVRLRVGSAGGVRRRRVVGGEGYGRRGFGQSHRRCGSCRLLLRHRVRH